MKRLFIYFNFFLLIFSQQLFSQTDSTAVATSSTYYSPENILKFADFLWNKGDLLRAATEYQRYLFSGAKQGRSRVYFHIGRCYLESSHPDLAADNFKMAYKMTPASAFRDSSAAAYLSSLFLSDRKLEFFHFMNQADTSQASPFLKSRLVALKTLYLLRNHQWQAAQSVLQKNTPAGDGHFVSLQRIAERGLHLPKKSPLVAGLASALIPGSGKIYVGRTFDGLYSLLVIGGSAWLSYEGFRDRGISSGKGWVFGLAAAFFHVGNIYGSVTAAKLNNIHAEEKLDNEVQTQISIWTYF